MAKVQHFRSASAADGVEAFAGIIAIELFEIPHCQRTPKATREGARKYDWGIVHQS